MRQVLQRLFRLGLVTLFVTTLSIFSGIIRVSAEEPKTWFDLSQEPTLDATWTISADNFIQSITQGYGPKCTNGTFMTRPGRILPPQTQQTVNRCWHPTGIGLLAAPGENLLIAPGIAIAGPINGRPSSSSLRPTPNPTTLLDIRSGTSSNYVRFHFGANVSTQKATNGTVTHDMTADETFTLKTSSDTNVALAVGQGMNYSKNGKWATGVTVNYAMFRINMETKQILNFGAPQAHGAGYNPFMRISISEDGHYAVATVTSPNGNQWMRVYDLQDCQDSEHAYVSLIHANCKYRDLENFLETSIPNYNRYTMAEFAGNDALIFYHFNADAPQLYTQFIMRAPNADQRDDTNYIALGDSYSSGEGAFAYEPGTDEGNNRCHLSRLSYPYLLNKQLGLDSMHSVACSGAGIANINGGSAQYANYPSDMSLGYWLPGYQEQIRFIQENPADIVTIGIGGNNIDFSGKIRRCLMPDTCFRSFEERLQVAKEINALFGKLVELYSQLRDEVLVKNSYGRLYVTGYPQVAKIGGKCGNNVRLNSEEIEIASYIISHINGVLRQAAKKSGVVYVNTENALDGFRLCETDNDLAINGLTAGNDKFAKIGPIGNESYHPTAKGHKMFAASINSRTDGLVISMPSPDPSATAPDILSSLLLQNAPKSGEKIRELRHNAQMVGDTLTKDAEHTISVNGTEYELKANTTYEAVVTSTSVSLGSYSTDDDGNLTANITFPVSLEPGIHTLHLYGKNIYEQDVDIYKILYIAETTEDWDGDGTPNSLEKCHLVEPMGIDEDDDGVDDACDGEYVSFSVSEPTINGPGQTIDPSTQPSDSNLLAESRVLSSSSNNSGTAERPNEDTSLDFASSQKRLSARQGKGWLIALLVIFILLICYVLLGLRLFGHNVSGA